MPSADQSNPVDKAIRRMTPVSALPNERPELVALRQLLDFRSGKDTGCKLVGPSGETLAIPDSIFHVLKRVVEVMARGDAITVVPVDQQLTTQQAANILNMSRQYLVRLLDKGELNYARTGTHRRLKIEDVLEFKRRRDRQRSEALDSLVEMSEEIGGYEELK